MYSQEVCCLGYYLYGDFGWNYFYCLQLANSSCISEPPWSSSVFIFIECSVVKSDALLECIHFRMNCMALDQVDEYLYCKPGMNRKDFHSRPDLSLRKTTWREFLWLSCGLTEKTFQQFCFSEKFCIKCLLCSSSLFKLAHVKLNKWANKDFG